MRILGPRYHQALKLREEGKQLKEIGEALGVSRCRAGQMVAIARHWKKRQPSELDQLSIRIQNRLEIMGVETKADALKAWNEGKFSKKNKTGMWEDPLRNLGDGSMNEIKIWLGVSDVKVCKCCGRPL